MKVLSTLLSLRPAHTALLVVAALGASGLTLPAHATRIKEVAAIQGVRSNQLTGYGLVVGLDGTGDQTTQMPYTKQALANYLEQMGIALPATGNAAQLQLKNVAAVIITAELPAFAQPGQAIDINVSSMGNAKSLKGGTLVATPLRGADGEIYAWPRAMWWSAVPGLRPAAPRCRSTT
jgi:flagellar P-ring protein precursor FlgI